MRVAGGRQQFSYDGMTFEDGCLVKVRVRVRVGLTEPYEGMTFEDGCLVKVRVRVRVGLTEP